VSHPADTMVSQLGKASNQGKSMSVLMAQDQALSSRRHWRHRQRVRLLQPPHQGSRHPYHHDRNPHWPPVVCLTLCWFLFLV
jgi:hypothetical protein